MDVCFSECLVGVDGSRGSSGLKTCELETWTAGYSRGGSLSSGASNSSAESAQHSEILGAALQEAHPPVFQVSLTVSLTPLSWFHVLLTSVLCPLRRRLPGPLLRLFVVQLPRTQPRSDTPCRSMALPGSKLPRSLSPFFQELASFSVMKAHCDRHLGGFLEGPAP